MSVSDMLDNVDSDSFDFDQFDETTAGETGHDEEPEFDVNKMPDPFTASPEEMGIGPDAGMPQQQAQQQPEQNDEQMSKEDAMRILEALENDEKDVQEKVQKQKAQPQRRRTQKDW